MVSHHFSDVARACLYGHSTMELYQNGTML